jgi:hypothetical protein
VGGVAGQKHPTGAEAAGHPVMEREAGGVLGLLDARGARHVPVNHLLGVRRVGPLAGGVIAEEQPQAPPGSDIAQNP